MRRERAGLGWTQSLKIEGLNGSYGNHWSFGERKLERLTRLRPRPLDHGGPSGGSRSTTCARSDRP